MALFNCVKAKTQVSHISCQLLGGSGNQIMANLRSWKHEGHTKVTVNNMSVSNMTNVSIYWYDGANTTYLYRNGAWENHTVNMTFRASDGFGQLTIEGTSTAPSNDWCIGRMENIILE